MTHMDDLRTSARKHIEEKRLEPLDAPELPVVDREHRLVGVFTAADAIDVLQTVTTDDMYDKVGLLDVTQRETDRSARVLKGSFGHVLAVRVPFLLITLAGEDARRVCDRPVRGHPGRGSRYSDLHPGDWGSTKPPIPIPSSPRSRT